MSTGTQGDQSGIPLDENEELKVRDQAVSETIDSKDGSEQQERTESEQRTRYIASIYPSNDPHLPPIPP